MVGSVTHSAMWGLQQASESLYRSAQRAANQPLEQPARDTVDRISSLVTYKANAAVIRTGDEMLGTVLDIVG